MEFSKQRSQSSLAAREIRPGAAAETVQDKIASRTEMAIVGKYIFVSVSSF